MSHSHTPVKGAIMLRDRAAFCSEDTQAFRFLRCDSWFFAVVLHRHALGLDSRENNLNIPVMNNSQVRQGLLSGASAFIALDNNLKLPFLLTEYCALLGRVSLAPRALFCVNYHCWAEEFNKCLEWFAHKMKWCHGVLCPIRSQVDGQAFLALRFKVFVVSSQTQ